MKRHLVDTPAKIAEQRDAIGVAMGYPVRGRVMRNGVDVTGTGHDKLPQVYGGRGTPGWCDYDVEIVASDDATIAALEITPRAEIQLGRTVRVSGRDVSIQGPGGLVPDAALPAKIRAVLDRR